MRLMARVWQEQPEHSQQCWAVHCGLASLRQFASRSSVLSLPRYPIGGDSQSVTSGVVSRIEVTAYVHGSTELLGMQIDAAINSAPFCRSMFSRHHSQCFC